MTTKNQVSVLFQIVSIYLEAIRAAGPAGIPSGHIYATVMGQGISLDAHNAIVEILTKTGKITSANHLLTIA